MPQCAVATCRNSHRKTKGRRVRYHRFPAEDDVRIRWVSVCGRGGGASAISFNPSTARVCSLHFSPNSYERDVEHELLGLTPRSRLKKGAVPDRGVPITLPSLINKRRPPPRQRQQQVTKAGSKRKVNRKRQPFQDYEEEDYTVRDPNGFDILLALGLTPNKARRESDYLHDLNRMHVMEEDGSIKHSTAAVEDDPKANGPMMHEDDVDDKEAEVDEVKENGDRGEESADGVDEENTEGGDEGSSVRSGEGKIDGEIAVDLDSKTDNPDEDIPKENKIDEQADQTDDLKESDSLPPSPVAEEDSGGSLDEEKGTKRECSDSDSDTPSVVKKMKITHAEYDERERTVNEYVESAAGASLDEIQRYADKIQQEVDTLNAMARAKEHEWNNIIRLKKVKEEMFLRLQRKKQVMMIMMGTESREDWDLADIRYGECSDDRGKTTRNNSKGKSSRMLSEHRSAAGVSLLRNNQHHHSLMMVPIVSSSPGNVPISSQSIQASALRVPDVNPKDRSTGRMHRPILPKPPTVNGNNNQNPVIGEGRQGPILDVRSIIADYRSRHPETVPRRGRRLKSSLSPTNQLPENLVSSTRVTGGGGILSMANLALGSGSQMRTGIVGSTSVEMNDLGLLLNAVGEATRQESSRPSSADSSRSGAQSQQNTETGRSNISFKDVLVQFAKMSQTEQRLDHLPPANQPSKPPPYPDVTLHPVLSPPSPPHQSPSSSLLHGILTKSSNMQQQQQQQQRVDNNRPATFSPTLARLLTAPERVPSNAHVHAAAPTHQHFRPQGQVSISDLLSTSKQTRNEITITPVGANQSQLKSKQEVILLEEEQEDSADRLVIDESGDVEGGRDRGENDDGHGSVQDILAEDVPECQGCHQRTAQFVCAGCGNQWYCSRDCQVTAWDEHSDVCSG